MQPCRPCLRGVGKRRCDLDATGGEPYQAESGELVEVHRPEQGAAALCGGGEPEKIGDRSRAQECGPPSPGRGMTERVPAYVRCRHW